MYTALTTMVTIGNQASGDTGLKICTSGLIAPYSLGLRPQATPTGMAIRLASTKPVNTVSRLVPIWSKKVGLPVYSRHLISASGLRSSLAALRSSCR